MDGFPGQPSAPHKGTPSLSFSGLSALRVHAGELPAEREPSAESTKRCRHGATEEDCCTKRNRSSGCSLVSATRSGGGVGGGGVDGGAGAACTAGMEGAAGVAGAAGEVGAVGEVGVAVAATGVDGAGRREWPACLGGGARGEGRRAPMGEGWGERWGDMLERSDEGREEGCGGEGEKRQLSEVERQLSEVERSSSEIPSREVDSSPRESGPGFGLGRGAGLGLG
jgi:hypothetical protein